MKTTKKITRFVGITAILMTMATMLFATTTFAERTVTDTEYYEDFESYSDTNYQNTLLGLKDYDWYMADDNELYTNVAAVAPYSWVNYKLARIITSDGTKCLQIVSAGEMHNGDNELIPTYGYGKTFPGVDADGAVTGIWEINFDFKPYLNGGTTQFAFTLNTADGSASSEAGAKHNIIAGYGTNFYLGYRDYNNLENNNVAQGILPASKIGGVTWYSVKTILNCDARYYTVELYDKETGELIARRSPVSFDSHESIGFLKFSALGFKKTSCVYVDNISIKQTEKDNIIYNETFDTFKNNSYVAKDGMTTGVSPEDYTGNSYFEGYTPWRFHQNTGNSYSLEQNDEISSQVVRLGDLLSTEDTKEASGLVYMQVNETLLNQTTEYQRGMLKTTFKINPEKIVDDFTLNVIPTASYDIKASKYELFKITNHENTPAVINENGKYSALNASEWYNVEMLFDVVNRKITTKVTDLSGNEITYNSVSGVSVPYAVKGMMFKAEGGTSVLMDDVKLEYFMPAPKVCESNIVFKDSFGNSKTNTINTTTALKTIEIPFECLLDEVTATTSTILIEDKNGEAVSYSGLVSGSSYIMNLDDTLKLNEEYTITIKKSISNIFGDTLENDVTFTFKTTTSNSSLFMEISAVNSNESPLADLADIKAGSIINVLASYVNNTEESKSADAILAFYENDRLVDIQTLNLTVQPGTDESTFEFIIPEDFDIESVDKMSIFIWDGFYYANPLSIKTDFVKSPDTTVDFEEYVDFVVNIESGRDAVILQLTDTQIIDATQVREGVSFSKEKVEFWQPSLMDERLFGDLKEIIEEVNPDLILLTGDLVYGGYDDAGTSFTKLADFIDGYDIPWAPVFGNHDNESEMGADWQCDYLENNCENCLFEQKTLTGNGNYSIGIVQGGELQRVIFMLDSNGCGVMSDATFNNGHSKKTAGFGNDQILWYTDAAEKINDDFEDVKYTFAFHIQLAAFEDALYNTYGFINGGEVNENKDLVEPLNIDERADKKPTDFGYIGRSLKGPWDTDRSVYNGMKALGADSILSGHEHCNSASVVYDGIRFQYGQKIGEYDRINFRSNTGEIIGSIAFNTAAGTPILGGTVMELSESTGEIENAYIYYCNQ